VDVYCPDLTLKPVAGVPPGVVALLNWLIISRR
jgi:hypothetical protein